MNLIYDTVAIPVAKGINVNTAARLVEPSQLLEAVNSRLGPGGSQKRRGHTARRVRNVTPIPPDITVPDMDPPASFLPYSKGDRGIPTDWLFGWGPILEGTRTDPTVANGTSSHPDSCLLFGSAQRDTESLTWNGFELLSHTPSQAETSPLVTQRDAVLPWLRSATIAKCNQTQNRPDVADNGVIRVAAWIDPVTDDVYYSVVDSVTGATFLNATVLSTPNDPVAVRCIPVGTWVHVLVSMDNSDLYRFSIQQSNPRTKVTATLGLCDKYFDVWKIDETRWLLARNTSETTEVIASFHNADGSNAAVASPTITLPLGPITVAVKAVAVCWHPTISEITLAWREDSGMAGYRVYARTYDTNGTPLFAAVLLDNVSSLDRAVAIAPKYIHVDTGGLYDIYYDDTVSSKSLVKSYRYQSLEAGGSAAPLATRHRVGLSTQAFRAGDRTFVWTYHASPLQRTYFLLDEKLLPVGHAEYATANCEVAGSPYLASVNWAGTSPVKDVLVHHCALSYRIRNSVEDETIGVTPPPVYSEPSIKFVEMDFLPPLRSAQAGRSTYFPGAQLWSYDGIDLHESGFHLAPELDSIVATPPGALTPTGKYRYRIDLCYRNAQGEEVRSHSFYSDELELPGGQGGIILQWAPVITRRENAYCLIFRNEDEGVQWYLVNSRDPDSTDFVRNDQSVATLTYTDDGDVTDAELLRCEQHPGNGGFSFIAPIAAPACEVIAGGADRLWVAGGELPYGTVAPSRLFQPGEVPAFNPLVAAQIDRSLEPITAIGFVGEVTAIFRRNATYIQEGVGPNNSSEGSWPAARLAIAGIGAVSQESLGLIPGGLAFQSSSGFRVLGPSGGLVPIGLPVDRVAKSFTVSSAFVSTEDQEIRFYSRAQGTMVYNYHYDTWCTWTVNAAGVSQNPASRLALVATPDGMLYEEIEGAWRDGDRPYRHRIRFAWLRHGALLDFQRVRRIAGIGNASTAHTLRLALYYDEQDFEREVFTWNWPEDGDDPSWNSDTFGSNYFGDGTFGDTESHPHVGGFDPYIFDLLVFNTGDAKIATETEFRDAVWRWRRRPERQKCSVISIALDDDYSDGAGFTLTALGLEIGKKPGLDRIPWRGGSGVAPSGSNAIGNGR